MTQRIAIYGGSFDPPHVAHVMVAAYVLGTGQVDELWVIPTWQHPLDKVINATFEQRLAMCELAFASLKNVRILPIESELGGPSRTLHTLEALGKRHKDASFRLVMGADLMAETHRWHAWDRVRTLAPPLLVGRDGHDPGTTPFDFPAISSSDIRHRVAKGEAVDGLLPGAVARYIAEHRLYA